MAVALRRETRSLKAWVEAQGGLHPPPHRPLNANQATTFFFFFHVSDVISPSKGNTKDVRKLEERKTDPLNLEGYVGPAPLPRPPEKDRGECWGQARKCRELHRGSVAGRVRASQPPVGAGKVHGERGARPPAQSTGARAGGPGVTACPLGPAGALCTALSSPQMTRSLALLQKALRFPKSASPCRALLPSKVRKVKVPGPGRRRASGRVAPMAVCHPSVPCSSVGTISGGASASRVGHQARVCR